MTTCHICTRKTAAEETWYCYWCGKPTCNGCAVAIQLPLDTTAVACRHCQDRFSEAHGEADDPTLEIVVNAALSGHELGVWVETESADGWQATCRTCEQTVWVGVTGMQYSLLSDVCTQTS